MLFNIFPMAIDKVDIHAFVELAKYYPVLDVRSPVEFKHAHFPCAFNLALFSDEERKVVGTAYKQNGREEAIKIGLEYFGVKMRRMVEEVEAIVAQWPLQEGEQNLTGDGLLNQVKEPAAVPNRRSGGVLVHCLRGGMRSTAIAWLLNLYGFKVYLLIGGYKKFRQYVLETFKIPFALNVLGGYTGSGKTSILHELAKEQLKTIDLEGLANHKGSAFGTLGPQPSQEMFENVLALQLRERSVESPLHSGSGIWLEDESQRIGTVIIPQDLWEQMRRSSVYFLDIPFDERLKHLLLEYGTVDKQSLAESILRIQKKLGGLETKNAIHFLRDDNTKESFRILLTYYDRCYSKSLAQRTSGETNNYNIFCDTADNKVNAAKLMIITGSKQLSF